jgi:hypothetical protein
MQHPRITTGACVLLGLLVLALAASADVIDPREGACRDRKAGASCTIGGARGTCVERTCGRNDYSGGVPPKSRSVPCVVCEVSQAPAGVAGTPEVAPGSAAALGIGALVLAGGVILAWRWHRRASERSHPTHD